MAKWPKRGKKTRHSAFGIREGEENAEAAEEDTEDAERDGERCVVA